MMVRCVGLCSVVARLTHLTLHHCIPQRPGGQILGISTKQAYKTAVLHLRDPAHIYQGDYSIHPSCIAATRA